MMWKKMGLQKHYNKLTKKSKASTINILVVAKPCNALKSSTKIIYTWNIFNY